MADRTYHCYKTINRCLPFYDHFCPYFQGPLFQHNAKYYVHFTTFLLLHILFLLACTIFAFTKPQLRTWFTWSWVVLVLPVMSFLSALLVRNMWLEFFFLGTTDKEDIEYYRFVRFRHAGFESTWKFYTEDKTTNPWNLGFWGNFRLIMGDSWWKWFLFWTASPVRHLEEWPTRFQFEATEPTLTPLNTRSPDNRLKQILQRTPFPLGRRGQAASTGVEEVELASTPDTRRRPQTSA